MNESNNSHDNQAAMSNAEVYELFLLFQSLDDLKKSILMVLAHIYPKTVTATQLSELAGYSTQSKYIFKSKALEALQKENLIEIRRPTKRLMLIKLHPDNVLLYKFATICQIEGDAIADQFWARLAEMEDME
ncbi:MAG: hypothetical protein ACFFCZ_02680 [Promethearchaeota archaeon]